ncbi:MAG: DNA polymerase III subunit beta [Actinobacteria bacterium]|nr:DNA polymerase III subunit beta [Actinomycetota bacterium]
MRVSLNQADLNSALQIVQKAVSSRSILPILSGVLFDVGEDFIDLYTTDLEMSIKYRLPVKADSGGSVIVPARLLGDIVKNLPDARIDLRGDENHGSIDFTCGSSSFNIKVFSPEGFPQFPDMQKEVSISVSGKDLVESIRQVVRAVSKDETRPVLTGVLMIIEEGRLKMVATDSYRLSIREMEVERASADKIKFIVPARCLDEIARICVDDSVEVGLAKNQIYFNVGEIVLVSRLIEGQFPNYQQLLPNDCMLRVRFNKDNLLSSLKRVSLLAQNSALIKMKVAGNTAQIEAMTQDVGSANEEVAVEIIGEGMEIAFNAQFLIDGLSSIGEEEVFLELNSPLKPGLLRPTVDQDLIYLVMPVRVG